MEKLILNIHGVLMLESVNAASPVVVDDEVFISETYDPDYPPQFESGKSTVVWKDEEFSSQSDAGTGILGLCRWICYGCRVSTQNADLRCVDWTTGKVMWSIPRTTRCSLTYIDGHFLCQGEYGHLFLFKANPKAFEPIAGDIEQGDREGEYELPFKTTYDLNYPAWAAPVVSHGLLYVRGTDKVVVELITKVSSVPTK